MIEEFTNAFILYLSGAADMKNAKEVKWTISRMDITIEFPTNTPEYVIVRRYGPHDEIALENEYRNGVLDGYSIVEDYFKRVERKYKAGKLNGRCTEFRKYKKEEHPLLSTAEEWTAYVASHKKNHIPLTVPIIETYMVRDNEKEFIDNELQKVTMFYNTGNGNGNGSVSQIKEYQEGFLRRELVFFDNGTLKSEKRFDENGQCEYEKEYRYGSKEYL